MTRQARWTVVMLVILSTAIPLCLLPPAPVQANAVVAFPSLAKRSLNEYANCISSHLDCHDK